DMDAISLATRNEIFSLVVKENISDNIHKPSFAQEKVSPYNMPVATEELQFLDFSLVDIDGDTDLDLFTLAIGGEAFQIDYYENIQCVESREELFIDICEGSVYEGYSQSGVYIDTVQNSQDCDSIRTLNLTVHPVYDQTQRYMKCDGDTLYLGDQVITSSGNYLTTLKSIMGCDSTITANVTFYLIDASVTLDENELSTVQGYETYQWINCTTGEDITGQTSEIFTPEQTGSYAVRITTATGCIKTSDCIEVVVSSIEQQILSSKIEVYPNPTNGQFLLKNSTGKKIDRFRIIDFNGRNIKDLLFPKNLQFTIEGIVPGCYLVLVTLGDYVIPKKLIII
ncbi:MAG: T9SS type A sorting domain-containing protein, partial [Saprospiraceae bacterium]|nr:T9SS type A sorting domain-containing protein [Saprospiraceae bacterium]